MGERRGGDQLEKLALLVIKQTRIKRLSGSSLSWHSFWSSYQLRGKMDKGYPVSAIGPTGHPNGLPKQKEAYRLQEQVNTKEMPRVQSKQ